MCLSSHVSKRGKVLSIILLSQSYLSICVILIYNLCVILTYTHGFCSLMPVTLKVTSENLNFKYF